MCSGAYPEAPRWPMSSTGASAGADPPEDAPALEAASATRAAVRTVNNLNSSLLLLHDPLRHYERLRQAADVLLQNVHVAAKRLDVLTLKTVNPLPSAGTPQGTRRHAPGNSTRYHFPLLSLHSSTTAARINRFRRNGAS